MRTSLPSLLSPAMGSFNVPSGSTPTNLAEHLAPAPVSIIINASACSASRTCTNMEPFKLFSWDAALS